MAEHLIVYGDADVRQRLFDEVSTKEQIVEIIKDSHSHHFLMKILKHGSKDQRQKIFSAIEGQVVRLAKQKFASQVLELAYSDFATAAQRSAMMQEFFGPRFRYFKEEGIKTLSDILEKHPTKKKDVMADLKKGLQVIMHKGIFNNSLILGLLREYMIHCDDPADINLVIESLEDGLLPVIHTKDGSKIAMMCLWRGTAKQRKTIIKSFKGHMIEVATWDNSYMVLLAALDCIEDTKFLRKAILDVLMAEKEKLLQSEIGVRVFRYMVLGRNKTYVHPDVLTVLEKGEVCSQNKKPRELCRLEILQYMTSSILEAVTVNLPIWCRDTHWTLFLGAAIHVLPDPASKRAAMTALAQYCAKEVLEGEKSLMDLGPFSKMLTFLVGKDACNKKDKMPLFTLILIEHASKTVVSWLSCNRGCFLMVKALETNVGRVVVSVRELVSPHTHVVKKIKSQSSGAKLLLQKLKDAENVVASEDEMEELEPQTQEKSAGEVQDGNADNNDEDGEDDDDEEDNEDDDDEEDNEDDDDEEGNDEVNDGIQHKAGEDESDEDDVEEEELDGEEEDDEEEDSDDDQEDEGDADSNEDEE
ncbi:CPL domain [Trinorchestia longiramus]|nr:CPL domain [Trinorchestia longiramus]